MIYVAAFLLLVAGLTYISLKREGSLIALAICMFGVETLFASQSTYFVDHSSFANLVIAAALMFRCGFAFVRGQAVNPFGTNTWRLAGLLIGVCLFTYLWTPETEQFTENWKRGGPYVLIYLLLVPMMMSSMEVARRTLMWTLAIGAVVTLVLFFGTDWQGRGIVLAGQSRFADKRDTAAVLAIAQLGGVVAIIAALIKIEKKRWTTFLRWAIVILGMAVIFRTGSRGQTVAAIGCIAAFVPLHNRSMSLRGVVTILGSIGIVGFAGYYMYLEFGDQGRWQHSHSALAHRMEMWGVMFQYWVRGGPVAWFFGLGNASAYKYVGFYIHNIPIEILCEEGLIGFTIYALLFKRVIENGFLTLRVGEMMEPFRFNVLAIFLALFTFEVLLTLKSGSFHAQQLFILYGVAIEVALRGWQNDFNYLDDDDEYYDEYDDDPTQLDHGEYAYEDTEFEFEEEYANYEDDWVEEERTPVSWSSKWNDPA
ncbi:MAG: O-antigen ligase family protein [Planctomycetota bacterium]